MSDGAQSLTPKVFAETMTTCRKVASALSLRSANPCSRDAEMARPAPVATKGSGRSGSVIVEAGTPASTRSMIWESPL